MEGKTVQLQHLRTEDIETVAGLKAGSCAKQWSCPKNCGFSTSHPLALKKNFVRYSKSLTVGVKKKKNIPLCHVAHELTSRTYDEKKWWVVIVKDQ